MDIKLEGGGGKALVAWPQQKCFYLRLPLGGLKVNCDDVTHPHRFFLTNTVQCTEYNNQIGFISLMTKWPKVTYESG